MVDADQGAIVLPVLLALVLSTAIGLEREAGAKAAGLRTHALVGLSAAVIMVISKYGFADLLGLDHIALDPSRIAAQIVSGIGFLAGGLIFVRRDAVRGLTTAATVWLVAGFTVRNIDVTREDLDDDGRRVAAVTLQLAGRGDLGDLAGEVAELPGVHTAHTGATDHE